MPKEQQNEPTWEEKLEAEGEAAVRRGVAIGRYGDPGNPVRALTESWLRQREAERTNEVTARNLELMTQQVRIAAEQLRVASSAKTATWAAAIAAFAAVLLALFGLS